MDGKTYPAGSYVVPLQQPFGAYAKALLERQQYPDLHEYPGGPPKRPYDVTAHTLPLLFGVNVATVMGDAPAAKPTLLPAFRDPTFVSPMTNTTKRIAIYRSSTSESMDAGWTRWLFDVNHVPFKQINETDLAAGNLRSRFDVIVIPDGSAGIAPGGGRGGRGRGGAVAADTASAGRGATGATAGASALGAFATDGGTVLAFNGSAAALASTLQLPVRNVLAGVPNTEFYCPGSILAVEIDKANAFARDFTAPTPAVWFEGSPAFEITDPSAATAIATYPASGDPLLSGWLLGGSRLNAKAALVDVRRGQGHVVLYGFRPQYRGQTNATFSLIWAAMR